MKVKNQILVIGGYGQVGSRICTMLSGKYPGKVIAAGKNLAKAEPSAEVRRERLFR